MSVSTEWDDDAKTIICIVYHGVWDWTEYDAAIDQAIQMAKDQTQRVDLVINTLEGSAPPKGNSLWHVRRAMRLSPLNLIMTVTVGVQQGSFFKSVIMSTVFKMFPRAAEHAAFARTLDEARALIAAQRQAQPHKLAAQS